MPDRSPSSSVLSADALRKLGHELRSPLSTIKGCATVLEEELHQLSGTLPAMAEFVEIICHSAIQGLTQIPRLIDLLKIETGNLELSPTSVSVNAVIESVIRQYQNRIDSADLGLQLDLASDLPQVSADRDFLSRVIEELIANALRFTTEGSLTIRTSNTSDAVTIEIEDTGIGFEQSEADRIFDPFVQIVNPPVDDAQRHSGIGLALVRGLVSSMGGTVGAHSVIGSGSIFTIELPRSALS